MARVLAIFIGLLGLTGVLFWASKLPAPGSAPQQGLSSTGTGTPGVNLPAPDSGTAGPIAPLFGAVTVDPAGVAKVSGKANPGDEITLLVNEKAAGVQTAGTDGAWAFTIDAPSKEGEKVLAIASRDAKGATQIVGDRVKIAPATEGEQPEVTLVAQNGSVQVLQKPGKPGEVTSGITVEKAETAGEGKVSLGGKADPGMTMKALIGGEPVGEAKVDPLGRWAIEGTAKATGSLRLEMLNDKGDVKDQIDLPFTVASAPDAAKATTDATKAKEEADAKAKADADAAKAKEEADAKAKADADAAKAKEEADAKAKADADAAKAKEDADAKAKADADAAKAKEEADAKAKADADAKTAADAKAKEEADAKAKAEADAKTAADAKAKEEADAKLKAEADAKAKADEIAKATRLAEQAAAAAAKEAAAKVAGAINPGANIADTLNKAAGAVTQTTDGTSAKRPKAAKRAKGQRARAAQRQFVARYVRMTEVRTVTVRRGDSLWRIAERKAGDGDRWVQIRDARGRIIRNPDRIVPGQKVRVKVTTIRKVYKPGKKMRHHKMRHRHRR